MRLQRREDYRSPSLEEHGAVVAADARTAPGRNPTGGGFGIPGPIAGRDDQDQASLGYGSDGEYPRVGPYRLIQRLGRGSQGEVWKAVRLEPPVEIVALKLLMPPGRRDPRRLARFRREAERGASLSGRGILPIFEFGQDGKVVFFAMPLVDGFTLCRVLAQRRGLRAGRTPPRWHRMAELPEPLYIGAVARVLASVARALEDAHAARVVHCDVKPANILLDRCDGGPVYLIDFGLGRDLDAMPESRPVRAGTVLYMAPEKLSGRRVDEALCDIYALGATGFEAVALRPPRVLPEGLPRSLWARYLAEAEPPRPRTILPRLPEELEAILTRAMARDPGRRYQSAMAMAEDLERFLCRVAAR
jgi:eukaryotic-like serine/threonine-protein kinase